MTLLNGAGQPVWGSNRPSVLVWSVVDEDRTRRFLSGSEREPLVDVMQAVQGLGCTTLLPGNGSGRRVVCL